MKVNTLKLIAITLMGIFTIFNLYAGTAFAKGKGDHQGPPPEAYTVCEGKSSGDTASFESPHGDAVTGTCVKDRNDDRLVLQPDNPPSHGPSDNKNDQTIEDMQK